MPPRWTGPAAFIKISHYGAPQWLTWYGTYSTIYSGHPGLIPTQVICPVSFPSLTLFPVWLLSYQIKAERPPQKKFLKNVTNPIEDDIKKDAQKAQDVSQVDLAWNDTSMQLFRDLVYLVAQAWKVYQRLSSH